MLCIDVFDDVENCFSFLRDLRSRGNALIFHIPLDMNVQMVIRSAPILMVRFIRRRPSRSRRIQPLRSERVWLRRAIVVLYTERCGSAQKLESSDSSTPAQIAVFDPQGSDGQTAGRVFVTGLRSSAPNGQSKDARRRKERLGRSPLQSARISWALRRR